MNNEIFLPKEMIIVSETDSKGNIIFANEDFCKIAGYSLNELIGKPHSLVRHEDMPKAAFKDLWEKYNQEKFGKVLLKIEQNQVIITG